MKNFSIITAAIATTLFTLTPSSYAGNTLTTAMPVSVAANVSNAVPIANDFMSVLQRSGLQNWMTHHQIQSIEIKKVYARFGAATISVIPRGLYKQYDDIILRDINKKVRDAFSVFNGMLPNDSDLTIQLKSTDKGQLYLTFSDMNLNNADVDFQNLNNLLKNPIFQQSYVKDVNNVVSGLELKLAN